MDRQWQHNVWAWQWDLYEDPLEGSGDETSVKLVYNSVQCCTLIENEPFSASIC